MRVGVCTALLVLFLAGIASGAESPSADSTYAAIFEEICRTVEDNFYDPSAVRNTFAGAKSKYRSKLGSAATSREFSGLVNDLLGELHASHTSYYTADDWEYYQLAEIFTFFPEIQRIFKGGEVTFPSIGILTRTIGGKPFIASILPGSPAHTAGLLAGDEILDVDGKSYSSIASLREGVGRGTAFRVRRTENGAPVTVTVRPVMVNPKREFLEAEKKSVTVHERNGKKIGYIHIWSYAGEEYQQALVEALAEEPLRSTDALILDVRYGWGGANPQYLNIFNRRVPVLSGSDRTGKTFVSDSQWRKPVLLLVNGTVRSGKEVLAYGFKKYALGPVLGETTAGAVLAGRPFILSDGSMLFLAAASALVDGERLEGVGVKPDIPVPADIRYCRGSDVQLERAIEHLAARGGKK